MVIDIKQVLELDCILTSMNKVIQANRSSKYVGAKMKKDNTKLVAWNCKAQEIKPFGKKIDLDITFHCKDKRTDKDNIISTTKFILDGLVEAGVIPNDGWSEIGNLNYNFKIDKKRPRTIVEMEEV